MFQSCKEKNTSQSAEHEHNSTDTYTTVHKELSDKEIKSYHQKLSVFFDTTLINKNFNGAVLVAKDGNVLYENYIGYQNPGRKLDTITENTAFHLASTSKPFTGMAILRLVQDGHLNLEDPLQKFLPDFPYNGITVRQLLSHRSGLPNYLYFMDDKQKWKADAPITNQDVLNFMITYRPPISYAPDKHFSYCNTNYVLLALIIEKLTGKSFPTYIKKSIFEPLRMEHSFVFTRADSFRTIMSYKPSGAVWPNDKFEYTYGDKNIYSTPKDMLKWDQALYNPSFINQDLLDSAYQPQSHEVPSIHNYGLGWRMLNLANGKNVIYHFGRWHGFTPAFSRLTDENVTIVILGNVFNKNIYNAAKNAYNIFGDYFQSNIENEDNERVSGPILLQPPPEKVKPKENKEPKPITKNKLATTTVKEPLKKVAKKADNNPKLLKESKKPETKTQEKNQKTTTKQPISKDNKKQNPIKNKDTKKSSQNLKELQKQKNNYLDKKKK